MAVAVEDTAVDGTAGTLTTSFSGTVTPAGSNRLDLALTSQRTASPVLTLTRGGSATGVTQQINQAQSTLVENWGHYFLAPATSDATWTAAFDANARATLTVLSLSGVDQSTPFGDSDVIAGSSNPSSEGITVDCAAGDLVVGWAAYQNTPTLTPSATGGTLVTLANWTVSNTAQFSGYLIATGSTATITIGASTTANGRIFHVLVVKQSVAAAASAGLHTNRIITARRRRR